MGREINKICKSFLGNMNLNQEQQLAMTRMIKKLALEKKKFDGFVLNSSYLIIKNKKFCI